MPYGPVIPHTKAHRRKAVKGGPVHLEESCEEFKRASWEVQKKYHFALPRIKDIEKLIEGVGFTIVDSRQIMDMIYTVTGEK